MDDFEKFYNLALRFLSYRPRSEQEVRDYLKRKTHNAKRKTTVQNSKLETAEIEIEIDRVIQKLKGQKLINDEEFAGMFLENRLRFKPRSSRLIRLELKQKGIDPETISNLQLTIDSDLESAKKLVEKRLSKYKGLGRQKIYEKLGRYLASKGFNWDTIKKAIDEVLKKGV